MSKPRPFRLTVVLVFLLTCLVPAAFGQSATATLSGTVQDQNGAIVPDANVTVLNAATSLRRQTSTSDRGYFTVPLLPPGTYSVLTERQGFAPVKVPEVVLNVGDQKSLQIQLKAGDVNAMVTVDSNAEAIRTDAAVATVVDRQFVANIPLNGRSFQALITLTPGVVLTGALSGEFGGQFSVNGQRATSNSFMVDGVSANVGTTANSVPGPQTGGNLPGLTVLGTTQSLVSVDAMQEFKVQTSGYAAEYGRQPGGQISIQTRSGTNQFHGSLFDYFRNDVFDANNWFLNASGRPKPPTRQNDFGGTFSGPVMLPRFGEGGSQPGYNGRNRTFFFFSYEGLRLRQPKFLLTNVPTLCVRGLGSCPSGHSPAAPAVQPFLKAFPVPAGGRDLGNGFAEYSAGYSNPSNLNATSIRIDHTITTRLTVFGRYNNAPSETAARGAASILSQISKQRLATQTITLGTNASFTSRLGNEFRFNFSRNDATRNIRLDDFGGAVPFDPGLLCLPQYCAPQRNSSISFVLPGLVIPQLTISQTLGSQEQRNLVDNFFYTTGPHQLKFGVDYRRLTPVYASSVYRAFASFTSQAQVLSGVAGSGGVRANAIVKPVYVNFSAYAQDTWKISQRLTLDLGARWEVNPAPKLFGSDQALAATQIQNLSTMQLAPRGAALWKTTFNNFAPRMGIAYLISRHSGRETVLRGGFGVFYDSGNETGSGGLTSYPFQGSRNFTNVVFPLSPALFTPPPLPTSLVPPYPSVTLLDPSLRLPYTLQWNGAVEQSLGKNQTLTASYVGAAGRRLLHTGSLNLRTINPSFTDVTLVTNRSTSDYHALQAQFRRRLSRGLQALVSYTWSHAIDEDSVSYAGFTGIVAISPQRGNADFDVRHVFGGALTYDIPVPKTTGFMYQLLHGWATDVDIHAQSAYPFDILSSTIVSPIDGSVISTRPNVIAGIPLYANDPTAPGGRIINNAVPTATQIASAGCVPLSSSTPAKGAFCTPPTGQQGTFGRNVLRGFAVWQVDFAFRRQINLTERVNLQIRAEAFNLFNHPNFGPISKSLAAANFGRATNTLDQSLNGINALYQIGGARSMQFALKLGF